MDIADSMINCYHGIESIGKPYNLEGIMEDQSFESKGKSNVNSIDWHGYAGNFQTCSWNLTGKAPLVCQLVPAVLPLSPGDPSGRAHARRHSSLPDSTPKQPEYRPLATAASLRRAQVPFRRSSSAALG